MEGYTILARPDLVLQWNGAGGWALYRRSSNGDLSFVWDFHEQCDTPTEAEAFASKYLSALGN
ncbi:hypothetical protein UFOVP325_36 [uncultured Caudovirales phage]|uniref:Uncharacterized protein n=1 Tax=uncultured Caudovirales phage TaxID=2100421 RepID=A0A6J5MR19_9CAUD|nr:hypothetical protein UFOVP325_36 [uncultured Caudovirales phage]CAB4147506.1 hypothetical protein UFOVP430_31 [uncultured Caudovirales phage]